MVRTRSRISGNCHKWWVENTPSTWGKLFRSSQELAAQVGITQANLSILKTGKAKAIRFSTLDAICKALDCQPGDILEYREEESQ